MDYFQFIFGSFNLKIKDLKLKCVEQDYIRWKNLMKRSDKNLRKKITNKLEYVFMPAGSLYSLMINKINHQTEQSKEEDCAG